MKKIVFLVLAFMLLFTSALALTSCDEAETYDVVFFVDENVYSKITTSGNKVLPLPPDPKKADHTFEGWFYDEGIWLEPYDNTAWEQVSLTRNVTLYAKWKRDGVCDEHTLGEFSEVKGATCKEKGLKQAVCTVCGETISEYIPISETHTPADEVVVEDYVETSCKADGSYKEVLYCTVCDKVLSTEEKTIPKLEHTPKQTAVWEKIQDSTCEKEGSYQSVVYCSVCNSEVSRENCVIEVKSHSADTNVCEMCNVDFLTYLYSEELDGYIVTGAAVNTYTEIVIPAKHEGKQVKAIGECAFKNFTSLVKIEIPFNVMSIGMDAFYECVSLRTVDYIGKKAEWKLITVETGNESLTSANINYKNNFTDWMPF